MASLLGIGYPGAFNGARRRLQRVWTPATDTHDPYPHHLFSTEGAPPSEVAARRRARLEYEQGRILTVPEWGGLKFPGSEWSYSRSRGEALRDLGPEALGRD